MAAKNYLEPFVYKHTMQWVSSQPAKNHLVRTSFCLYLFIMVANSGRPDGWIYRVPETAVPGSYSSYLAKTLLQPLCSKLSFHKVRERVHAYCWDSELEVRKQLQNHSSGKNLESHLPGEKIGLSHGLP